MWVHVVGPHDGAAWTCFHKAHSFMVATPEDKHREVDTEEYHAETNS